MIKPKNIKHTLVDSMLIDSYEVFFTDDFVDNGITLFHSHDCYEIHITLSGNGIFYIDGVEYKLESGSILLIHSDEIHKIVSQDSDYFERMYIFITKGFLRKHSTLHTNLEQCFEPIGNMKSKVLKTSMEDIILDIIKLSKLPNKKIFGDDIRYEQDIINFLIFINKQIDNNNFALLDKPMVKNELIENIITYINNNLSNDLSLDTLSKIFFVSKYYISHKFKETTGITLQTYVLNKRLIYAKQLLIRHKNSSSIYYDCGFSSYSYFLKTFKKNFGITPKEFIKQNNEHITVNFERHNR